MCIGALFARAGAPLNNVRWSWGAVRPADGAVFLRVWQDDQKMLDGKCYVRLTANQIFAKDNPSNLGYRERARHVQLVQQGKPLFMIMCRARDPQAHPRRIAGFNDHELFVGGEWKECNGEVWAELADQIPIGEVQQALGNP